MNLTDKIEKERKKVVAVDLDGTLTHVSYIKNFWELSMNELGEYYISLNPNRNMIRETNRLHRRGFTINIFTSRWDLYKRQTTEWLRKNHVRYDELIMNKPFYDFILDDKCVKLDEVRSIK